MLHILGGSDISKAKKYALTLAETREIVRFGEGEHEFEEVLTYLGAHGMFSSEIALLIDRPCETSEGEELLAQHMKDFAESETLVVVIEPALPASLKKKIPQSAKVESFELPHPIEEPPTSIFALADAFGAGDRKRAWILYRTFIQEGMAPEEIHGTLAWSARSFVLAAKTKSAAEAGLKPFVFTKAKRVADRLGLSGAETLSRELVSLYHDARRGKGSLEDLLEVFLLKKSEN